MLKTIASALPLILLATGCRYDNVRVHSYWGTTVYRPVAGSIYEWSPDSGHIAPGQDERIAQVIQEDFEAEMAAMGFIKRTGMETPDLIISAHAGRGLQPSPSGPEQRANLAIRVLWATDGQLLYCANADALIEPSITPEERRARVARTIHEIMKPLDPCAHCRRR